MTADFVDSNLKDLIEISRFYGGNKDYVLAGGGNTSYKNKDKLWIKASGIALQNIDESGFVCLSRELLKAISVKQYSSDVLQREAQVKNDLNEAIVGKSQRRPSVETSLHEIIEYSFVVHTHPSMVNGLLCSRKSKSISLELFGEDVLFIEYTDPGYILFKKVEEELIKYRKRVGRDPNVILLENHGIFVAANSIGEINSIYQDIKVKLIDRIGQKMPDEKSVLGRVEIKELYKNLLPADLELNLFGFTSWTIHHFVKDRLEFEKVSIPFTPDIIVYCKSKYLFFEENDLEDLDMLRRATKNFIEQEKYVPKVIGLEGKGILVIEENEKAALTVGEIFQDFMKISFYTESFGGQKPMTPEQIKFIDTWEVENYRRKISKTTSSN